jgi:class 3 adenylate cyclase
MFADVSGFTALAERHDPESLQQVMNRYFAVMREVVGRHGGIVAKVLGDAVMVLFGVPAAHEDDAGRAARCSLEMHVALDALNDEIQAGWGERLRTHTGIATGEVVVAAGERGEVVVYGDAVNVARRLQESAARGDILVGTVTARLLRGVRLAPVTPMRLKGKAMPVEAWRLEGLADEVIAAAAPRGRSSAAARSLPRCGTRSTACSRPRGPPA